MFASPTAALISTASARRRGLQAPAQFAKEACQSANDETNLNPGLNGRDMRKAFDTRDYRVMIVANKFQTGFDQPKLVAMYLDKKVSGVEAVQTLSRLNRTWAGKDKTFVIDFANEPNEIEQAFRTFYRDARMSGRAGPEHRLRHQAQARWRPALRRRRGGGLCRGGGGQRCHAPEAVQPDAGADRPFQQPAEGADRGGGNLGARLAQADEAGDATAAAHADAQRSELAKQRDALLAFSEGLGKFVRSYEYVAQLVDFGDPSLEGFASFARLLRKRLAGVAPEQVDLSDLRLTHYKLYAKGGLDGVLKAGEPPALDPITDNGLREARDREKAYLSELIQRLNDAFGKEIGDTDQVAFAVHVSERLRGDDVVMAQVRNNPKTEAMKAKLPGAAVQAIVGAMATHKELANKLLSDEATRGVFLDVVYELLKQDGAGGLFGAAAAGPAGPPT